MKRLILWLIRQQWFINTTEEDFRILIRQKYCHHEFKMSDLEKTGIPDYPEPTTNDYKAWEKYYEVVYSFKHESHTKRVVWPCSKCGKTFYAHCGLDISPKHGPIVSST